MAMAAPGMSETHHAVRRYPLPAATMDPHAGVGGGTPAPRKLSVASTIMTQPTCKVTRTVQVATKLGKMERIALWEKMQETVFDIL